MTTLTPWERRNEYYSTIQLGKDIKMQNKILSRSTRSLISAQAASTSKIVLSQERIREGLDDISYGIGEVKEGIEGLKSAFEFGISEVVWQLEQNRETLKNILEVLMAPLDTQAKELKRRAEDAYGNGWYEDALEDFFDSENKNKYDFSVHISIGMIFMFHKHDEIKALEYFEKAVKYAKPKSSYYASFALIHIAVIKFGSGLIKEAEMLTDEAVLLTPNFAEALYQNAQYKAQLGNTTTAIIRLEQVIKIDRRYCLKIENDPLLVPIKNSVDALLLRLRDEKREQILLEKKSLSRIVDELRSLENTMKQFPKISSNTISTMNNNNVYYTHRNLTDGFGSYLNGEWKNKMTIVNDGIKMSASALERNSYFDLIDAETHISNKIRNVLVQMKNQICGEINRKQHVFNEVYSDISKKVENEKFDSEGRFRFGLLVFSLVLLVVLLSCSPLKFLPSLITVICVFTAGIFIMPQMPPPFMIMDMKLVKQEVSTIKPCLDKLMNIAGKIVV